MIGPSVAAKVELPSSASVTAQPAAGTVPYYSGLRGVDVLGKSDRTIARLRGLGVDDGSTITPGHNKLDLHYSIEKLRPDAIYDAVLRDPPRAAPRPLASGGRLAPLAARLGYLPGLALGVGLLGTRALRWHARRPTTSAARPVLDRPVHARGGNPV